MNKKLFFALLAIGGTQVAFAESIGGVTPKISTMGLGLEYQYPISNDFSISAGAYSLNYERSETRSGVKYDADLKLRFLSVLANYYPWETDFRFSGGLVLNGSQVDANGVATGGNYDFNGTSYTAAQIGSANAEVDFNNVAPYIGIGWDSGDRTKAGLSFSADVGAIFMGKPDVSFNVQCGAGVTAATCRNIQTDAEAERQELQDSLDDFNVYPVISIGAIYRF